MTGFVLRTLAGAGCLAVVFVAQRLFRFVQLYMLHESTIQRYNRPDSKAWAVMTGASDGIGKAIAKELQTRGINVILHGRNRTKLEAVAEQLKEDFPNLTTELAIGDASDPASAVQSVVEVVHKVKKRGGVLTILINNVGGEAIFGIKTYNEYAQLYSSMVDDVMNLNTLFPMQLTRALLPTLQRNQPALILNMSSYASLGSPFLVAYTAAKSAINLFSVALISEMKALYIDIEVMTLMIGPTVTPGNPGETKHMLSETAEEMAQACINVVGCGKTRVTPSLRHCLVAESAKWFPDAFAQKLLRDEVMRRRAEEQADLKNE